MGIMIGIPMSFGILFTLDQFPDVKLKLLNGNSVNYLGLAFFITASFMISFATIGFMLV